MVIVEPSGASQEASPSSFSEFLILLSWGSAHRCLEEPRSLLAASIVSVVMRRLMTLGGSYISRFRSIRSPPSTPLVHLLTTAGDNSFFCFSGFRMRIEARANALNCYFLPALNGIFSGTDE